MDLALEAAGAGQRLEAADRGQQVALLKSALSPDSTEARVLGREGETRHPVWIPLLFPDEQR